MAATTIKRVVSTKLDNDESFDGDAMDSFKPKPSTLKSTPTDGCVVSRKLLGTGFGVGLATGLGVTGIYVGLLSAVGATVGVFAESAVVGLAVGVIGADVGDFVGGPVVGDTVVGLAVGMSAIVGATVGSEVAFGSNVDGGAVEPSETQYVDS